jgi:hypothetical protein
MVKAALHTYTVIDVKEEHRLLVIVRHFFVVAERVNGKAQW